jgi:hypothetical protein
MDRGLLARIDMKRVTASYGSKLQMSSAEFSPALKRHGFRVVHAKIEDATGKCPGVSWSAVLRGRSAIDYNKRLAKVIEARNVELVRRGLDKIARSRTKADSVIEA